MICRIWRGWTAPADADAYERLLRETLDRFGARGRVSAGTVIGCSRLILLAWTRWHVAHSSTSAVVFNCAVSDRGAWML